MPGWARPSARESGEPEAFSWAGTTRRLTVLTNKAVHREAKVGRLTQIRKEENYGTGNSTDRVRRTQAPLGMVFGFGDCADRPRHDCDRFDVPDDHRVGVFLWLASHHRRSHGSHPCFLAQTLVRFFSRLVDGYPIRRRRLDDGDQHQGVRSLADFDYRHVLSF